MIIPLTIENFYWETRSVFFSRACPGDTSLTATSGQGYSPMHYDAGSSVGHSGLNKIPARTNTKLAVLFDVPRGTEPKEFRISLVYSNQLSSDTCFEYWNQKKDNALVQIVGP